MPARLAPLQPPFTEPVADALRRLMGAPDRESLALFRTLAHHDALLDRFRQVGSSLLSFGRLDAADRETVIHRTTARCGASYEWGVHAALFAPQVGRDDAWLAATWDGDADDPAFGARDALLVRMCDELHDTAALTDATWAQLRAAYADDELVELVCLAGFYHLVSFACGAFAIEGEPWAVAVG
jgi:alkylhydroperoxidase family enzyme